MLKTDEPNENGVVNILMVEDSAADIELTRIGLDTAEFVAEIHVAESGEAALRFLRNQDGAESAVSPDVVLLDLNLPGMDGRELLEVMRSDPELVDLPVVVLTTSDAAPDIAQAYDRFACAYLTKPVDFRQLQRILQDLSGDVFAVLRSTPVGDEPEGN